MELLSGITTKLLWGQAIKIAKVLLYPSLVNLDNTQEKNLHLQLEANSKLQHELQSSSQEFQQEIEKSRQEFEVVKLKAQQLIQKQQQKFDLSLFEEKKKLDLELQQKGHDLQIKLALLQWQKTRNTNEYQRILENHPWRLYPETIREFYNQYQDRSKPIPPLVIISPPEIDFEKLSRVNSKVNSEINLQVNSEVNSQFPSMEKGLAEALRIYLGNHYPKNDTQRPANFIGGAWDSKRMHSETAVMHLFYLLNSVPSLILESEIDGDYLNFHLASWDICQETYEYHPILSQFDYKKFLYRVAKVYALDWNERKNALLQQGLTLEEVEELEPKNEANLKILAKETKLKAAGYDKELDYNLTKDCIQELAEYLKVLHCVVVSLALDDYYWLRYRQSPQLPLLLPKLIAEIPDDEVWGLINVVVSHYQNLFQVLENNGDYSVAELALDVAEALTNLSDKSWAREIINYSIQSWLKLHQISYSQNPNIMAVIPLVVTMKDFQYLENLEKCLVILGDDEVVNQIQSLKKSLSSENQSQSFPSQENYKAGKESLDKAIQLNQNSSQDYYLRGIYHISLGNYQEAIADLDKAIEIKPNYHDAYIERGNAHFCQGLQQAIQDYNQGIEINPNFSEAIESKNCAESQLEKYQAKYQAKYQKYKINPQKETKFSNVSLSQKEKTERISEIEEISQIEDKQQTKSSETRQIFPQKDEIELISEVGIDYKRLKNFLENQQWQQADRETCKIMLQAARRENQGWLRVEDVDKLPCQDLHTIDKLWIHYSKSHFGFSIQKKIYQKLGGTKNYNSEIWNNFGNQVGWRVYGKWIDYINIIFNDTANYGHLPYSQQLFGSKDSFVCCFLFYHLESCKI